MSFVVLCPLVGIHLHRYFLQTTAVKLNAYRPPPLRADVNYYPEERKSITDSSPMVPKPPDYFFPKTDKRAKVLVSVFKDNISSRPPKRLEYLKHHPSVELDSITLPTIPDTPHTTPLIPRKNVTHMNDIESAAFVTKVAVNSSSRNVPNHLVQESGKQQQSSSAKNGLTPSTAISDSGSSSSLPKEPSNDIPMSRNNFLAIRSLFDNGGVSNLQNKAVSVESTGLLSPTIQNKELKFEINVKDKSPRSYINGLGYGSNGRNGTDYNNKQPLQVTNPNRKVIMKFNDDAPNIIIQSLK